MYHTKGISEETLRKVAEMYGKSIVKLNSTEGGYRNASHSFLTKDGDMLNFILYKREPGITSLIKRTNHLGKHISASGLPVRSPADNRIVKVGPRYGSLYSYLPGQTIAWEMYSMNHIKLLGYSLARFHVVSSDFRGELPNVEDIYAGILDKMQIYFSDDDVTTAMRNKLRLDVTIPDFANLLDIMRKSTDRQALHMDFVRGNLLFRKAEPDDTLSVGKISLSGIIDLEKASYGDRLFDIARTLAFLLVDCPKPAKKIYKYFLQSGYIKRGGGNLGEYSLSTLESLVSMFLLYDFYKFLRQNPYESLSENHHYARTVSILSQRNMVQSTH